MTCEQLRALEFFETTVAERASAMRHLECCEQCSAWVDNEAKQAAAIASPILIAQAVLYGELLAEKDAADPEGWTAK